MKLKNIFAPVIAITAPFVAKAATISNAERCAKFKEGFSTGSGNIAEGAPFFCNASDAIMFVINYILVISGSVTILFLVVGGFWYVTSAGNEEQAEKARKIIINSVIGLVVILMSAAIVRIVASTLNSA